MSNVRKDFLNNLYEAADYSHKEVFPGEDGMQSELVGLPDGRWSVGLRDADSGEMVGATIFPASGYNYAVAHAKDLAAGKEPKGMSEAIDDKGRELDSNGKLICARCGSTATHPVPERGNGLNKCRDCGVIFHENQHRPSDDIGESFFNPNSSTDAYLAGRQHARSGKPSAEGKYRGKDQEEYRRGYGQVRSVKVEDYSLSSQGQILKSSQILDKLNKVKTSFPVAASDADFHIGEITNIEKNGIRYSGQDFDILGSAVDFLYRLGYEPWNISEVKVDPVKLDAVDKHQDQKQASIDAYNAKRKTPVKYWAPKPEEEISESVHSSLRDHNAVLSVTDLPSWGTRVRTPEGGGVVDEASWDSNWGDLGGAVRVKLDSGETKTFSLYDVVNESTNTNPNPDTQKPQEIKFGQNQRKNSSLPGGGNPKLKQTVESVIDKAELGLIDFADKEVEKHPKVLNAIDNTVTDVENFEKKHPDITRAAKIGASVAFVAATESAEGPFDALVSLVEDKKKEKWPGTPPWNWDKDLQASVTRSILQTSDDLKKPVKRFDKPKKTEAATVFEGELEDRILAQRAQRAKEDDLADRQSKFYDKMANDAVPKKKKHWWSKNEAELPLFTDSQIAKLKSGYGAIKRVDPDGETYNKLHKKLGSLPTHQLKQLGDADIPWVSYIAKKHLKDREPKPTTEGTKGPYPFADKEAQYNNYNWDQLEYSAKDAFAAAQALGRDNPDSSWYMDDVSTIRKVQKQKFGSQQKTVESVVKDMLNEEGLIDLINGNVPADVVGDVLNFSTKNGRFYKKKIKKLKNKHKVKVT